MAPHAQSVLGPYLCSVHLSSPLAKVYEDGTVSARRWFRITHGYDGYGIRAHETRWLLPFCDSEHLISSFSPSNRVADHGDAVTKCRTGNLRTDGGSVAISIFVGSLNASDRRHDSQADRGAKLLGSELFYSWREILPMRITVKYLPPVSNLVGTTAEEVDILSGHRLGDLVEALVARHGTTMKRLLFDEKMEYKPKFLICINGECSVDLFSALKENDLVYFLQPVAGGRSLALTEFE